MSSYETNLGVGLPAWVLQLREHGYNSIAEAIDDDKLKSLQALERLGLPRYQTAITPIAEFLADPSSAYTELDLDWYMVVLNPTRAPELERKRKFGVTKAEVPEFITKTLTAAEVEQYDLILQESFIHCYGGNLACSADGSVILELIKGELGHNDLVVARKNPEFTMQRDPFTRLLRTTIKPEFGEASTELFSALARAMLAVPNRIDEADTSEIPLRRVVFDPGYYEFYLDRRTPTSSLEPFFIDCQASSLFQPHPVTSDAEALAALKEHDINPDGPYRRSSD